MKLGNIIKESIRKADFFKKNDLLRYKAQCEYRTVFGGTVSLILITLLIITFYQRFLSCIQKNQTYSTQQKIIQEIPSLYQIQTYPQGNFMLAVSMRNFSLPQTLRFFHISMNSMVALWDYQNNQWNESQKIIPLQKCTRAHWKLLPRMDTEYDSWDLDNMLCLPMNATLEVQGDQLSDTSKKLKIQVSPCQNNFNQQIICAEKYEVDELFNSKEKLETRIYMINTNVNPSNQDYIQYIFNYRNLLTFTKDDGSEGTIFVQDYEIQTDESILPIPMKKTDTGATFSTKIIPKSHQRVSQDSAYCSFYIFKSDVSKRYIRTFDKLDQNLAFIGGLFGMLSMFLVIVNSYNNFAYEISLGSALFKPEDQNLMQTFNKYNFLSYLLQMIYAVLDTFGLSLDWKETIEYNKCQKEMEKQLDVEYFLDRLNYLQTATSTILEDYQVKGLHLKGKLTLTEARNKRKAFKLKKGIRQVQKTFQKNMNFDERGSNFMQPQNNERKSEQRSRESSPALFKIFRSNKIQPQSAQSPFSHSEIMPMKDYPRHTSDSSSDNEESSKSPHDNNEVVGILNLLRRDSIEGDKLSRKIWQNTNNVFVGSIPDFLTKRSSVVQNSNCDSLNSSINIHETQFTDISSEKESRSQRFFDSVILKPPKLINPTFKPSRFSKPTEEKEETDKRQNLETLGPINQEENDLKAILKKSRPFRKKDHILSKKISIIEASLGTQNNQN